MVQLSVVIPCYFEEDVLPQTIERVSAAAEAEYPNNHEILYVDDGSRDSTWELIQRAAGNNPAIRGIRLARNFGHQAALTAGLVESRGEIILVIDADLQDPPELLGPMRKRLEEGFDVVYGKRKRRENETPFKQVTAKLFYWLINWLSDVPIPADTGDFRLMRRPVVEAFLAMKEQHRFVRGMVAWVGFEQSPFEYDRPARAAGETKYPLFKMVRFATDAVTSFSVKPLRLASLGGLLGMGMAVVLAVYLLYSFAFLNVAPGWASLLAAVVFFGSAQLLTLGIIGEYLGRTYMESKQRPLYLISAKTSC